MKKPILFVALALGVALCGAIGSTPASAQFEIGSLEQASFNNALITRSQIIHNTGGALDPLSVRQRYIDRQGKGRGSRGVRGTRGVRGSRPVLRGSTRFKTNSATRRNLLANLVARTRAANPQSGAALERDFAKGDPIAAIAPALARYGIRTDDVADTMAVYLISAYYGVRGSNQDPSPASLRATRDQMRRALLSNRAFVSASNAAKQQMSDALLIQVMFDDRMLSGAKGNPARMASVKSAIRQNALQTFKLDLSKLKLTSQGLRA